MALRFLTIFSLLSLPCAYAATQARGGEILDYTLRVSIDIPASRITGLAKIPVQRGQEIKLNKGTLHLLDIRLEGQKIDFPRQEEIVRIFPSRPGVMEIRYAGTFNFPKPSEGAIAQGPMNVPSDVVDGRGIFLTGIWYPQPDQMCNYHLTATLPEGYEAISEAETVRKTTNDGQTIFSFTFPHPLDSIHLIATNRYTIVQDHFNGIEIFAYFFHEDARLAQTYIQHTKRYLRLYENLIGRYPYKRFSIVENFLPTGYSMPTYTLLGKEVVRLPFIVETSLGHEILHQWFGNLVYVNTDKGNWSEGLTTYLADHLYEEQKGLGFQYRKDLLIDYQSYVNDKNEFPLKDFQARTDFASKAIGYGKAAMVFHMLKTRIGQQAFYDSLKYFTAEMRFKKASWEDLQRAFDKNSAKDLSWFFNQWVDRRGLLELQVEDVKIKPREGKFEVHFVIIQKKDPESLPPRQGKT
jgi:aminopeptidase N